MEEHSIPGTGRRSSTAHGITPIVPRQLSTANFLRYIRFVHREWSFLLWMPMDPTNVRLQTTAPPTSLHSSSLTTTGSSLLRTWETHTGGTSLSTSLTRMHLT